MCYFVRMIVSRRRSIRRGGDVREAVLDGVPEEFRCGCAAEVVSALEIKICAGFEEEGP